MTLYRKLLRDLSARCLTLAGAIALAAIGVATFVAMAGCYRTLRDAEARYYRAHRLPDAYLDATRIPRDLTPELAADHAVRGVRDRIREPISVLLPGDPAPVPGVALSLPVPRRPVIGDVSLRTGAWFSAPDAAEVLVNAQFAAARGLAPGDRMRLLIGGASREFRVAGTAADPEHAFLLPPGGSLAPDPAGYAVVFMPRQVLAAASGLDGAANQLLFSLHRPRADTVAALVGRLERRLAGSGVRRAGPVWDWAGVKILRDKIAGLFGAAIAVPAVFLGVAALVLQVLMVRLVAQQRAVLGTLRAVGYTRRQVAAHVVGFGVVAGGAGAVAGLALGRALQGAMLGLYAEYFKLPGLAARVDPAVYAAGALAAVAAGALGAARAAGAAAALEPAQAMRPPPPERGGSLAIERWPALWGRLGFGPQRVLRGLGRNPRRAALAGAAVALATALVFALLGLLGSLDYLMRHQFEVTAREDLKVSLREPTDIAAAAELRGLPGVAAVEAQLAVAVELGRGHRRRRVSLTGLPRRSSMTVPVDRAGRRVPIPTRGLVLGRRLARRLGVRPGDALEVAVLTGHRRRTRAPVAAVVDVYVGTAAWCDAGYLAGLLGEAAATNVLAVKLQPGASRAAVTAALARRPGVTGTTDRRDALRRFREEVCRSQRASLRVIVGFAGVLAFATVLTISLVGLDERRREVGVLRAVGYTPGQVARLFAAEAALVAGAGVAVGLAGGRGLLAAFARAFDTELMRFPAVSTPADAAATAAWMTAVFAAAMAVVAWRIRRVDWGAALRARE